MNMPFINKLGIDSGSWSGNDCDSEEWFFSSIRQGFPSTNELRMKYAQTRNSYGWGTYTDFSCCWSSQWLEAAIWVRI